jgi:hypothetical protein
MLPRCYDGSKCLPRTDRPAPICGAARGCDKSIRGCLPARGFPKLTRLIDTGSRWPFPK